MSDNLEYKKRIELFGKKLSKCFETKLIHSKVAPDFLLLNKHISNSLDAPEEDLPPLLEYSSGDESETEAPPEASPDMTAFGAALLGETKPTPPRARSPSAAKSSPSRARSSNQLPGTSSSRFRTPSPRPQASDPRARSRSPLKCSNYEPRGEK